MKTFLFIAGANEDGGVFQKLSTSRWRRWSSLALFIALPFLLRGDELALIPGTPINLSLVTAGQPERQAEVAVSVDPTNPSRQVVAVIHKPFTAIRSYSTHDGGLTWQSILLPKPNGDEFSIAKPYSDPAVAHDHEGTVYVAYNIREKARGLLTCDVDGDGIAEEGCRDAIVVARSTNAGTSYTPFLVTVWDDTDVDKPFIEADDNLASPGTGNIYVGWTDTTPAIAGALNPIFFAKSTDRGETWTPREELAPDGSFVEFGIGLGGEVYAIWWDQNPGGPNVIHFRNLGVEGTGFGDIVTVVDDTGAQGSILASPDRSVTPVPSVDVDRSGGPHDGRIWVAFADFLNTGNRNEMDIFVTSSDDEGASWSDPLQVNLDGTDTAQFMPWLDVDDTDGAVGVFYYSAQDDPDDNVAVHVYYAHSDDGGETWTNTRVSTTPSDASGCPPDPDSYLDYIGLHEEANIAYMGWTSFEAAVGCERPSFFQDTLYNCLRHGNQAPVADAGPDMIVECTSPDGATVTLDGTGSLDPEDDTLSYLWSGIEFDDPSSPRPTATFPLGRTEVALTISDGCPSNSDTVTITVVDTTPPAIRVELEPNLLWPPNHRLVPVTATVSVTDICDPVPTFVLESISSDEPDNANGMGDGNTTDDIQGAEAGTPDTEFLLRAERAGSGDGRVYTITYSATDAAGNVVLATPGAPVPHDQGGVVEPLLVALNENSSGTLLDWTAVPGAAYYNVIRGSLQSLRETDSLIDIGTVSCIQGNVYPTFTEDGQVLTSSEVLFYLIEYVDVDGQATSYGTETTSKPRVPSAGACQ